MKKIIAEFYNGIIGSLDGTDKGFSSKKLSSVAVICLVIALHVKWFKSEHWEYIAEILFLDYTFILVCLGLATWQKVKTDEK
jgi:hypothetical protein